MPQEKKGKNPRVSKGAKTENAPVAKIEEPPQCYVHGEVWSWDERDKIRENVCVKESDYPLTKYTDGKNYCLFHLPSVDKWQKFERKFYERLKEIEKNIAQIETLPEDEREIAELANPYDFRFVWFPLEIEFQNYKFPVAVDFSWATFSADVNFNHANFLAKADFGEATFLADANFSRATFSAYAFFNKAIFSVATEFSGITFSAAVDFNQTKFSAAANFSETKFSDAAYFGSTEFSGVVFFVLTTFTSDVDFKSATFSSKVYFSSTIFTADASFRSTTFSALANFNSAAFSALAYFNSATFSEDTSFSMTTFTSDAYFDEAVFSADASFNSAVFSANASFSSAIFSANADFRWITFSADANFIETKFGKTGSTTFDDTSFAKGALFDRARFRNNVSFYSAMFGSESDVFFRKTFFAKNANFQYCAAQGYVRFSNLRQGKENKFDLQEAAFENASRISFHTVRLFPNWFVNVDARKFVFTDIKWKNLDSERRNKNIEAELENLKERGIKEQNKRLLEIACRQLGVNAEENNRYEEAAKFRYMAMETKRLEELKEKSFSRYLIWLYKWTSGYGESWSWAAMVLLGVLLFFGALYVSPLSKFDYGEKKDDAVLVDLIVEESDWTRKYDERFHRMNLGEGLVHSLYVAALQRPEPKAADTLTKLFIILETIFAPVQAALLALAIRRKFMR